MPTSTDDKVKRLGSMELFRHCTGKDLEAIAAITKERTLEPGIALCDQGRVAQECFVVLDGTADVEVGGRPVATVGSGETIGEMGLLDHLPRSATVTARTVMHTYVIESGPFEQVLRNSGVARALLELLSRRIRDLETGRAGTTARY
jgi:CRP/FNR family transcriptional regulator, cyclic AMP receptor protein